MEYAPIVLFVYNRLYHTQQTIEALRKNALASFSSLYIISDNSKNANDVNNVAEVRNYIANVSGFKTVKIILRENNYGLADNIVEGVTSIVNQYGKVIVLEDDIITSVGFLKYMNDALNTYASDERIMHISGYMYPINSKKIQDTFFLNITSCWGWGTWKSAWKYLNKDATFLYNEIKSKDLIEYFNLENTYNWFKHLELNVNGTLNTWAVRWYASVVLKNGFCLHPKISLTKNIGKDGTGVNCSEDKNFDKQKLTDNIDVNKIDVTESKFIRKLAANYFKTRKKKSFLKIIMYMFKLDGLKKQFFNK